MIEALLSVALLVLLATPIFVAQSAIFFRIMHVVGALQRTYMAQNFLNDARGAAKDAQQFSLEKKIEEPLTQVKYQASLVEKKSTFGSVQGLVHEQVSCTWQELGIKRTDTIVSFLFKPPKPEKKE